MSFDSVSLSEPTIWLTVAIALLLIDLSVGFSAFLFLTLASVAMVGVTLVFPLISFAEASAIFSVLSFLSYFAVKRFVKKDKVQEINYANEELKNKIFKLEQDVSADAISRIKVNHIPYMVMAKEDYKQGSRVMVYDVRDGVIYITNNIPVHEFSSEADIWGDIEHPKAGKYKAAQDKCLQGSETIKSNSSSDDSSTSCGSVGD